MDFADFNYCQVCGRKAEAENHFIMGGRLAIQTPYGAFSLVQMVCVFSLPDEKEDCPMVNYSFPVHEGSLRRSIEKAQLSKSEAHKRIGEENIDFMKAIERKLDDKKEKD